MSAQAAPDPAVGPTGSTMDTTYGLAGPIGPTGMIGPPGYGWEQVWLGIPAARRCPLCNRPYQIACLIGYDTGERYRAECDCGADVGIGWFGPEAETPEEALAAALKEVEVFLMTRAL
jgi:hypothetical protein